MSAKNICPHCNTQDTLRLPNIIDKSLGVAKFMGNTATTAKVTFGMFASTPGAFGIGERYRSDDAVPYKICNRCGRCCFYCLQCKKNVPLSFRPDAFDQFPCSSCSRIYWYRGK